MTTWIDRLADGMKSDEKERNRQHQHDLLRDRLIAERAPAFFETLIKTIREQAQELNDKVGGTYRGVNCGQMGTYQVSVSTGNGAVSLRCCLNVPGRAFTSDVEWSGVLETGGRHRDFRFDVNTAGGGDVWVVCEGKRYNDPAAIAELVLKEAFVRQIA